MISVQQNQANAPKMRPKPDGYHNIDKLVAFTLTLEEKADNKYRCLKLNGIGKPIILILCLFHAGIEI